MKSKTSFLPVFEVGVVNDEMPACRQINTAKIDPAIVAGMCVSIIDFTVSKIEDSKMQLKPQPIYLENTLSKLYALFSQFYALAS